MTLPEALAAAGASLTEDCATTQDVAARLKLARCEGRPADPVKCPLARWYRTALAGQRMLPRRRDVCVDGTTWGHAYLYVHVLGGQGADACPPVRMPPLLVEFAREFDSGGFAELRA